ncbi:MAG: hypothetical protein ACOYMG_28415, partial [Candidatus Methylumidiphilus sp.]
WPPATFCRSLLPLSLGGQIPCSAGGIVDKRAEFFALKSGAPALLPAVLDFVLKLLDFLGSQGKEAVDAVVPSGPGIGMRGGTVSHMRAISSGVSP